MADRPIIFSAPMVRALIEGRKTQTRRVLKPEPYEYRGKWWVTDRVSGDCELQDWANGHVGVGLPYAPGDRLYVREAWAPLDALSHIDCGAQALSDRGFYRADESTTPGEILRWRPSIHMPRWASRLTLTVTEVRVQRLQDISAYDVQAEGACELACLPPVEDDEIEARAVFRDLWNNLHGPEAWDANPWVVALTFTVQHGNIDKIGVASR